MLNPGRNSHATRFSQRNQAPWTETRTALERRGGDAHHFVAHPRARE
jgi:hypothetical protein